MSSFTTLLTENAPFSMTHYTTLYQARLGIDQKKVIVKTWRVIGLNQSSRAKFRQRLESEVAAWRTVSSHPNIANLIGLTPGDPILPGIILDEYRNGNVNEYLSRQPSVDLFNILIGIASGLEYMHSQKPPIVHGKVRGSNILISDEGKPLLSDLGMRNLPYPTDLTMANTRESLNEVRWMAPELIDVPSDSNGCTEDLYPLFPPNDVHSFGMTALEIITRCPPFAHRRNPSGVIMDVTSGVRPTRPASPELGDDVWDLLTSCWRHEPGKRPSMAVVAGWTRVLSLTRQISSVGEIGQS